MLNPALWYGLGCVLHAHAFPAYKAGREQLEVELRPDEGLLKPKPGSLCNTPLPFAHTVTIRSRYSLATGRWQSDCSSIQFWWMLVGLGMVDCCLL
jgi:hypothetical protein